MDSKSVPPLLETVPPELEYLDMPEDRGLRYNFSYQFPFEANFKPIPATIWMHHNWTQSMSISVMYVIFIYLGRKLMASRKPFELKTELVLWNSFLAIFSMMGAIRFGTDFFWILTQYGFKFSLCVCSFHRGVSAFWVDAFAWSKALEMGDTAFLVLRKRPVIFLHWYHHITVMIYTWHGFREHAAAGRWFVVMNFSVHSVMYSYFALRAMGVRFYKWIPMTITILQLSQMVVGVTVCLSVFVVKNIWGQPCRQTQENQYLGVAMYFSYLCLFLHFFYKAYFQKSSKAKPDSQDKSITEDERKHQQNGVHVSNGSHHVGKNGLGKMGSYLPEVFDTNGVVTNGVQVNGDLKSRKKRHA